MGPLHLLPSGEGPLRYRSVQVALPLPYGRAITRDEIAHPFMVRVLTLTHHMGEGESILITFIFVCVRWIALILSFCKTFYFCSELFRILSFCSVLLFGICDKS